VKAIKKENAYQRGDERILKCISIYTLDMHTFLAYDKNDFICRG